MADSSDKKPAWIDLPLEGEASAADPTLGGRPVVTAPPQLEPRSPASSRRWLGFLLALAAPLVGLAVWLLKPTPPLAVVSVDLMDFADVRLGAEGRLDLVVSNGGESPLLLDHLAVVDASASSGFAVDGVEACLGREIDIETSCSVTVRFAPQTAGRHVARLHWSGNGLDGERTLPLLGRGIAPELYAEPELVDFGESTVGYRGDRGQIRLENRGSADLSLAAVTLDGSGAADFVRFDDHCSATVLAPGGRCVVRFEFVPTADGERRATLQVEGDATLGAAPALVGLGLPQEPLLASDPDRLDFGRVRLGASAEPVTMTLRNEGSGPLRIHQIGVTVPSAEGPADDMFGETLVGSRTEETQLSFPIDDVGCVGTTLEPGAACEMLVAFAPRLEAALGAVVDIEHDGAAVAHRVPVVGTGIAPRVAYSETTVAFGEVPVGRPSSPRRLEIRSVGTDDLVIRRVAVVGVDDSAYSVAADGCTSRPIPPGLSCTVEIGFRPRREGPQRAELRIRHDADPRPGGVEEAGDRLTLSGVGTTARLALEPTRFDFGNLRLTESARASFRLRNTGRAPLDIADVEIFGGDELAIVESCVRQTILPGRACRIELRLAPRSVGAKQFRLEITHGAEARPRKVPIEALVLPAPEPDIAVEPGRLRFPTRPLGQNAVQRLTVRNPGAAALVFEGFDIAGGAPGDFEIGSGDCAGALAAGDACTLELVFRPTAVGSRAAALVIRHNAPEGQLRVLLEGVGEAPPPPPPSPAPGGE